MRDLSINERVERKRSLKSRPCYSGVDTRIAHFALTFFINIHITHTNNLAGEGGGEDSVNVFKTPTSC